MEPSKDKPDFDQNTLIADFNAITQNENTAIALHYLEMSSYDMNVF